MYHQCSNTLRGNARAYKPIAACQPSQEVSGRQSYKLWSLVSRSELPVALLSLIDKRTAIDNPRIGGRNLEREIEGNTRPIELPQLNKG